MPMNPYDIKGSVEQLAALADGWARTGAIPPIERDLALEKLRRIYEDLLVAASGEVVPLQTASGTAEAMSINLDEVLSVELEHNASEEYGVAEPETAGGVGVPSPAEAEAKEFADVVPEAEPEVEVELIFADEAEGEPAPDYQYESESAPEAIDESESLEASVLSAERQPGSDDVVASDGEPIGAMAEEASPADTAAKPASHAGTPVAHHSATEVPEFVRPTVSIAADKSLDADAQDVPAPHAVVDGAAQSAASPAMCEQQSGDDVAVPSEGTASTPAVQQPHHEPLPEATDEDTHTQSGYSGEASRTMVQSLFGPEDPEELRRHKTKQRILMSLYDLPETSTAASVAGSARQAPDFPALRAEARQVAEEPRESAGEEPELPSVEAGLKEVVLPEVEGMMAEGAVIEVMTVEASEPEGAMEPAFEAEAGPDASVVRAAHSETLRSGGVSVSEAVVPSRAAGEVAAVGSVLGDVINHDVRTLADELSASRHDVASELARRESVDDLRKAIGINDKFLMIHDLFGGDAEAYERAIDALNAFDNLDDCLIHIAEHYAWNPNSDGAKLLMELLERKLA